LPRPRRFFQIFALPQPTIINPFGDLAMQNVIVKHFRVVKTATFVAIAAAKNDHVNAEFPANFAFALLPWSRAQRRFVLLLVVITIEVAKKEFVVLEQSFYN
jgi:hypothetical protein